MGRILSVQDLSCVGRCSLTVALPVLSAMGHQCSVLPTAVLSTHTGFPNPQVVDLTDSLTAFAAHWRENGIGFDAVSVGYLSDPRQAELVAAILAQFHCPVILDPVMGDNGTLYRRITRDHITALRQLAARADVLLPNLTEAAALTGRDYREDADAAYLNSLLDGLLNLGCKAAVITGIRLRPDTIGFYGKAAGQDSFCCQRPYIPRQCHGTGDLFAAVLAGSLLRGDSLETAGVTAAEFVQACVENTKEVTPQGVAFEPLLHRLWENSK